MKAKNNINFENSFFVIEIIKSRKIRKIDKIRKLWYLVLYYVLYFLIVIQKHDFWRGDWRDHPILDGIWYVLSGMETRNVPRIQSSIYYIQNSALLVANQTYTKTQEKVEILPPALSESFHLHFTSSIMIQISESSPFLDH